MMIEKQKGSALVDYFLPTALIGIVVGMTLYVLFSDGLLVNFFAKSSDGVVQTGKSELVIGQSDKAGMYGGKPDAPVQKCSLDTCTIDFGDYILTGIPGNFGEYIETQGTSGGTDLAAQLFEQLADQLAQQGDTQGAAEYKKLANLSHMIACVQKGVEDAANSCKSAADPKKCFSSKLQATNTIVTPSELDGITNGNGWKSNSLISSINIYANLGSARINQLNNKAYFDKSKDQYPSWLALDTFDNILASDKYSDSLKGATISIAQQITDLCSNLNGAREIFIGSTGQDYVRQCDIMTGSQTQVPVSANSLDNLFIHPITSQGVDFNSSIMCGLGYNSDTGYSCN